MRISDLEFRRVLFRSQRTCEVMKQLKTDDPATVRAAGVIDLPTLQRYLNFHYSVTIDLFGADQSSNAAIFYGSGLKGRYEEGKRDADPQPRGRARCRARGWSRVYISVVAVTKKK